ncbi:ABC transporter ATP-binding protein [Thermobifida halotolerans]|uniref:ABC transporter ATP-binding protein n=1 Tax=Thermobifida halotolerans TaxID=483545 RepID=A0AA97M3S1_9ACTN|nr:ABC transporter ATP-binding protein [Thermobifida halotolerans]UOE19271.1 ABC transporter ATP-binding protein [Thermobifida halotolerans]
MAPTGPAVVIERLVKRYPAPGGGVTAVAGIDLTIGDGEIFGLLGPNGAGKTTTIETLVGLRTPTEGTVRVLGFDPVRQRDEIRRSVAVQPQQAAVFEFQTVAELLRAWASFYPDAADPDEVIERMGLTRSRDVRVARLSGGQRQRLLVGAALISRPGLLVLDEPSTGMDPNAREELWEAIRAHRDTGGTVLLSTHSMEEAEELCDRVAILDRGRIVACGAPEELVREHAPEQEVLFTVAAGSDLTWLEEHAGVLETTTVERPGGGVRVRLRTLDPDRVLVDVLTGPLDARRIQTGEAGLEEVFRRVTGRSFARADVTENAEEGA